MQNDRVYLDWNATAPLRAEAREALAAASGMTGNPSSVHSEGRAARKVMEDARAAIAAFVGSASGDVIFTSGATEANALALMPGQTRGTSPPVERLIVSAIEHSSVLAGGRFPKHLIAIAPVDSSAVIDLKRLQVVLADGPPALVSVMLANNETGAIQPIRAVADIVHAVGGLLHVDGVAALGKISINMRELDADLLSLSAHKIGGPKGVGALVAASDLRGLEPELRGGGQEKGRRAGTENLAGIAGFGAAALAASRELMDDTRHIEILRNRLEAGLRQTWGMTIFSDGVPRLPNTTLFGVPGLRAETAVIGFDLEGVAVSSGSACSSGKIQPSHVLEAMGLGRELTAGAVRLSLGWETTEQDIDRCVEAWRKLAGALLKRHETVLERF